MSTALLKAAKKLPAAERILLVEQIWDSLSESDAGSLTTAQHDELNRRLDRLETSGPKGSDWTRVKKRILTKRRRK